MRSGHLASVGEDHGVEADAKPGAFLHLAAALDQRHRADDARAGRDRQPSVGKDVARDARVDTIFEPGALAGDRRFDLEANDRTRPG